MFVTGPLGPETGKPRPNSPPHSSQWSREGCFFFHPLLLPLSRPLPCSIPWTVPYHWIFPARCPAFSYIPLSNLAFLINNWVIVWAYIKNHILVPQIIYEDLCEWNDSYNMNQKIYNTDWTAKLPSLVMSIVSAGHMPNSYAQFLYPSHRFKSYALFISLTHPPIPYAQIIRPSHLPKSYTQTICPNHRPKS